MSSPEIVYTERSDTKPEAELNALASVYRFLLEARGSKEAAHSAASDDGKERSKHVLATQKYNG